MKKNEVIRRFCALGTKVKDEIFKNEKTFDCFCDQQVFKLNEQFEEDIIKWIEHQIERAIAEEKIYNVKE